MTRFCSLAGIVAGLALPGAFGGAAVAGTPQEDVLSAFEGGNTPSANTLIECIDDAYHGLAEGTFQIDMQFRLITRVLGQPDVTSTGSASVVQQGTNLRFEADHDVVARSPGKGDTPPFFGRAESKLVFVRHGDEVRSLETGIPVAEGEFVTNAFKIDLSHFPPDVQERITGPFATLVEFDLLNAGVGLVVERETYQGDPVFVLRTQGATRISDADQVDFATFFVQPETCLVVRMEQHSEQIATGHFLEFEGDFAYTPGVLVRPGAFFLKLPADAVDLTDNPDFLAQIEAQEQFDNQVLGPVQ
jgi:hypothetical protein